MADEGEAVAPPEVPPPVVVDRAVDAVVAVVVVATWLVWFRWTDDGWFFLDEWALAGRGRSIGDFFEPYNNHLSVPYIAVYRVHMGLFGFSHYEVLRAIGLTALAAGPALLYLTTRRVVGTAWAAAMALAVLWTQGVSLEPGAMNHWAVLACTVVGAWAVRRADPGADRWVAGALVAGLLTAGGMVACAFGMGVYCLLGGATVRRWACVAVPTTAWGVWYLFQDRVDLPPELQLSRADGVEVIVDGHVETLRGLALGNAVLGALLGVVMLVVAVHRVRTYGRAGLVPLAAWWGASIVWWAGLVQSRQVLADPEAFRYRLVCSVFLFLALVPPEAPRLASARPWPRLVPATGWAARAAAPIAVAALAAVLVVGNLGTNEDEADLLARLGTRTHLQSLVAMADPPVMPDGVPLPLEAGLLTRQEMAQLRDWYGPDGLSGSELDQALAAAGAFRVDPVTEGRRIECLTDGGPFEVGPQGFVVPGGSVVTARRFGDELVEVVVVPEGEAALVRPVDLPVDGAWVVSGLFDRCTLRPG